MPDRLTTVAVSWRKRQRNHRLLFGAPAAMIRLDWRRRLAAFEPNSIFGYERWRANPYGTYDWQVFVLKSAVPMQVIDDVIGVKPGANILLSAHGKTHVRRAFLLLDHIKKTRPLEGLTAADWVYLNTLMRAGFRGKDLLDLVSAQ